MATNYNAVMNNVFDPDRGSSPPQNFEELDLDYMSATSNDQNNEGRRSILKLQKA